MERRKKTRSALTKMFNNHCNVWLGSVAFLIVFVCSQGSRLNMEENAGSPCYETDENGEENMSKPQVNSEYVYRLIGRWGI